MELIRGRAPTPAADRAVTAAALDRAADGGTPSVRVWAPHRQVAFGRRDVRSEGFEAAERTARDRGFQPVERSVGGRAVAYTGRTLAFACTVPVADTRTGLDERYDIATATVVETLRERGADVVRGEPPESYCPGDHSVRVRGGGKVAGLAQRVRTGAALVSGCLVVGAREEPPLVDVLAPVYDHLDVPFDPASVGSVESAGGPGSPDCVATAVETAFATGPWSDGTRHVKRLAERPLRGTGTDG